MRAQRGEKFGPGRPDRPTQAARSAAKIWVGTVPTDRPYLAHPGDVQCTIDFAPPGDNKLAMCKRHLAEHIARQLQKNSSIELKEYIDLALCGSCSS